MAELELFRRALDHLTRTAIIDQAEWSYADLLEKSGGIASALAAMLPTSTPPPRVAYLVEPGFSHVAIQWGIWRAGTIGVPLSPAQAPPEWAYVVDDSQAAMVIVDPHFHEAMQTAMGDRAVRIATVSAIAKDAHWTARSTSQAADAGALILYTSGTTGKPKGVLLTHANIEAQVRCLVEAWDWRAADRTLHVLPLHHVHGIVNVLTCALWAGAACVMEPRFDAARVWRLFRSAGPTLFMAVPTIYSKLIGEWDAASPEDRRAMSESCAAMRLMVSGSAALPVSVLEKWKQISGHVLLERYGMTEIGMALSNPLHGERRPGSVGVPLPGVHTRIVDEKGAVVPDGTPGELEVKGPGVFKEYWNRPEATAAAFHDRWFRTGDVAVIERGMYRLLGRQSVDIIKSGGYKISALEIEEVLREHPAIAECAVVGVEDPEWGEKIAVAAVLCSGQALAIDDLREWARPRLARYKLPSCLVTVQQLPRNAMGKVSKPNVKKLFDVER